MTTAPDQAIFNRTDLRRFRARAREGYARCDFLAQRTAQSLRDRLSDIRRKYPRAVLNGPHTPEHPSIQCSFSVNDGWSADVAASEEFLPFADNSLDLYLSNFTLHGAGDLPGTLVQIRRSLAPDGLFIAAMPGGETLTELREAMMKAELSVRGGVSPRIFPFADKQQMGALLQRAGFALPVVDSEKLTVTYETTHALMLDLRGMGESNAIAARDRRNPGKALFLETERIYRELYAEEDGRLPATFEIIYLIGWAPHSSQQKPLRPGSASIRLSDALETDEHNIPLR